MAGAVGADMPRPYLARRRVATRIYQASSRTYQTVMYVRRTKTLTPWAGATILFGSVRLARRCRRGKIAKRKKNEAKRGERKGSKKEGQGSRRETGSNGKGRETFAERFPYRHRCEARSDDGGSCVLLPRRQAPGIGSARVPPGYTASRPRSSSPRSRGAPRRLRNPIMPRRRRARRRDGLSS
jgi:hypothetical protein